MDWLALRFPRLAAVGRSRILRLPPRSRVRRVAVPRGIQLVFSAYDRGDFASAVRLGYPPEIVLELGELGAIAPDSPPVLRGRGALERFLETFHEAFAWTRWTLSELIDFGDAIVFSATQESEGRASGALVERLHHSAVRFEDGIAVWQRFFPSREEAIRAIGRDPAEVEPTSAAQR